VSAVGVKTQPLSAPINKKGQASTAIRNHHRE